MLPCIFGLSGPTLTPDERAFFKEAAPAGFILFGRNVEERAQLRALTDALREVAGRDDLLVLVDQEGGRVARLGPPRVNAQAIGLVLAEAGINVNCAPMLDLRHEGASSVVGDRAFGAEPMQVAALGRMVLDGLAAAGVAGVIKHMPGHGRADAD